MGWRMAGNVFDFELNANDNASKEIANIEAELNNLRPVLTDVRKQLSFGGDETAANMGILGDKLKDMSDFAKGGVQHIGDMIPPLKNLGALTGSLIKAGGIGAFISGGVDKIGQMATEGYNQTKNAKNTGMSVEESSRLSGTLQQMGIGGYDARAAMESYYEKLSQSLTPGGNAELLASIRSLGADIVQREDGSVDLTSTLLKLESAIEKIPEYRNWELKSKAQLPDELLTLLRDGGFDDKLLRSDELGLTRSQENAKRMNRINSWFNEWGAELTGKMNQIEETIVTGLSGDFSEQQAKAKQRSENFSKYQANNRYFSGDKNEDTFQWALHDESFLKELSWWDRLNFKSRDVSSEARKKINAKYGDEWEKRQQAASKKNVSAIADKIPDNWVQDKAFNPNRRGFRNNNPGNLIAAPNAIGRDYGNNHHYAQFANSRDGIAAMSRQLMLDAERGLNTISGYLQKYAPSKAGNNTNNYINRVSQQTGFGANEPLNMHDPSVLAKLLPAMIKVENGEQPFSYEQIMEGITDSIADDKWKGLRHPDKLSAQREKLEEASLNQRESLFKGTDSIQPLLDKMTTVIAQALKENQNNSSIEVVLTNPDVGVQKVVHTKAKGRVTTSMDVY